MVHDALRHARGAPGVEHVDVIAGPLHALHRCAVADDLFVVEDIVQEGLGAVVDLDIGPDLWQSVADLPDARRVAGLEEDDLGVGVVEQIDEFVELVTIVDVHGDASSLEDAVLSFEVLVRIVQVDGCLGVGTQAARLQEAGDPRRSFVVLAPASPELTADEGVAVGNRIGYGFPDRGEVQVHSRSSNGFND